VHGLVLIAALGFADRHTRSFPPSPCSESEEEVENPDSGRASANQSEQPPDVANNTIKRATSVPFERSTRIRRGRVR
jgi:hypothetical protein